MTERRRSEAQTLEQLSECDQDLIGQCDLLYSVLAHLAPAEALGADPLLREGLDAIGETLRRRAALLA